MGTEDEHQTILDIPVSVHIAQRLHKALFTCIEFLLQHPDVLIQLVDVGVELTDVVPDGVNRLTFVVNFVIDNH